MNQKLSADNNSPHPSVNVICIKRILRTDRGDESSQRVYPVDCEQHKTGAEEYDGLVYLAISDALNPKRRECLAVYQKIIDGDNTQDHRTHAGCYVYIHRDGALCVEGDIVHKENVKAAIEVRALQKSFRFRAGKQKGEHPIHSVKLTDDIRWRIFAPCRL